MHLVNNVNLVFPFRRGIGHLVTDLPDIINAVIGRSVNLYHIHGGAGVDGAAGSTFIARISVHRMLTVHRSCKNFGDTGLSRSSCPAEQVGVTDSIRHNLVFQSCNDRILSFHLTKGVRTELTIQCCIAHINAP